MKGSYWRDQAFNDILPYWTNYAPDTAFGAFFTNLDGEWKPGPDQRKYPSMIGRHLFSYSVAYLLSGDEKYLICAGQTKDYLLNYAWDKEYGGWFDVLNRDGTPAVMTKNMFIQTYALTGLAMYYFVTHDKEVLSYLEKSNRLLETHLWDKVSGGYFNKASRDWAIADTNKSFASQVAPVSGYLLYTYLATADKAWLTQSQRIMNVVAGRMCEKESGWVLESFDKDWNYLPGHPDEINVGHNLETAWMLMRLHLLADNPLYLELATRMGGNLSIRGFNAEKGFWYKGFVKADNGKHDEFTYWWIQAYGNMFDLMMFHVLGDHHYLDDFTQGARLWDADFVDRRYGDTFMSVFINGAVKDTVKANPYKTSYHSMEHCLLNEMYLSLWVNRVPVKLYFSIKTDNEGDTLHPVPIEDRYIMITRAYSTEDGSAFRLDNTRQAIVLPPSSKLKVAVILENKPILPVK